MRLKKSLIILSVFLIFFITYIFLDYTKEIESIEVNSSEKYYFSINENANNIEVTIFSKFEPMVKRVTIYNFDNDIVSSIIYEQHYINKINAVNSIKEIKNDGNYTNVGIKDNIILFKPVNKAEIGMTKSQLLEELSKLKYIYMEI